MIISYQWSMLLLCRHDNQSADTRYYVFTLRILFVCRSMKLKRELAKIVIKWKDIKPMNGGGQGGFDMDSRQALNHVRTYYTIYIFDVFLIADISTVLLIQFEWCITSIKWYITVFSCMVYYCYLRRYD